MGSRIVDESTIIPPHAGDDLLAGAPKPKPVHVVYADLELASCKALARAERAAQIAVYELWDNSDTVPDGVELDGQKHLEQPSQLPKSDV